MDGFVPTADLYDEYGTSLGSCDTQFRQFGARTRFHGVVSTLRCHEDNVLLREAVAEPGHGRVLVVDGDGSLHCALMGDRLAGLAADNGWEGVVVHGAVRDVAALATLDLGIKALGSNPRTSHKQRAGEREVPVAFGGAVFTPGATVVSDEDGLVVLPGTTGSPT